ncbi:enoyl-CoA-hydratase DpgB [Streptomyces sp. NPDC046727]|uniref:enoyl-CoA-hydratase DpgB n=1 Tax=Streptomyces sp. NPDC046727 TaxID=3155373 RepID=UPI0033F27591
MTTTSFQTDPGIDTQLLLRVDGSLPPSARAGADLNALCDRAEDTTTPAAVLLHVTGAPELPFPPRTDMQAVSRWERAVRRLERLNTPTVAVAEGDCGGLALDVLLATDLRLATADVRLVMTDHNGVGWPGMALYRLVQQVGAGRARRCVLFGAAVPADEAVELGIVDTFVPDVRSGIRRGHQAAVGRDGSELAVRRRLLHEASTVAFEDALGRHLAACDRLLRRTPPKDTP